MPINPKAMAVVAGLFVVVWAWRTWRSWRLQRKLARLPVVPANLVAGSSRTWLVFGSAGLADDLRRRHPRDRIVELDAARYPYLAASLGVRPESSAPVAVLADAAGRVRARVS